MTDSFSIRPASEDDLDQVLQIETEIQVAPWNREHFQTEMAKPYSRFWVVTDDETDEVIVAYCIAWVMPDGAQLLNLGVNLPFRRKGYAQKLIRALVQESLRENLDTISLEVRKSNGVAVQLYQKVGFVITQIRKRFYSNGEDAYQMNLSLVDDADSSLL